MSTERKEHVRAMCRAVERNPSNIGVYSTGEQIVVALILNRPDLLPESYSSILEAVGRLGLGWFEMALEIQREGWGL